MWTACGVFGVLGLLALIGIVLIIMHAVKGGPTIITRLTPRELCYPTTKIVFVFATYLFLMSSVGWVLRQILGQHVITSMRQHPGAGLSLELAILVAIGLVGILLARRYMDGAGLSMRFLGFVGNRSGEQVWMGVVAWLTSIPLIAVVMIIAVFAFRNVPMTTPPNPIADALAKAGSPFQLVMVFVLACIEAPLFEETFFRGVLFGAMRSRWGAWGAIFGSATVFAMVHPQLPMGFFPIFTIGFVLAYVRQWTGSLIPGMVIHCLNNAVALSIALMMLR